METNENIPLTEELAKFIDEAGQLPFRPSATYLPQQDSAFFFFSDEVSYAARIDETLTVYLSLEGDCLCGAQVKGLAEKLSALGLPQPTHGSCLPLDKVFMAALHGSRNEHFSKYSEVYDSAIGAQTAGVEVACEEAVVA